MPFFAMPDFYRKISFVDALTRVLILGELKKYPPFLCNLLYLRNNLISHSAGHYL